MQTCSVPGRGSHPSILPLPEADSAPPAARVLPSACRLQGFAHLLEHLAFRGTRDFPDFAAVKALERLGSSFGPHQNAYTGTDETVYQLQVSGCGNGLGFPGETVVGAERRGSPPSSGRSTHHLRNRAGSGRTNPHESFR